MMLKELSVVHTTIIAILKHYFPHEINSYFFHEINIQQQVETSDVCAEESEHQASEYASQALSGVYMSTPHGIIPGSTLALFQVNSRPK